MTTASTIAPGFTATATTAACCHCGAPCLGGLACAVNGFNFCCLGCRTVFELVHENGLERFYTLETSPGVRPAVADIPGVYACLDDATTRQRVIDFTDGKFTRVTFRVPSIHCVACVWLLENLFRLRRGIGPSQVNFSRKEVMVQFEDAALTLGDLAGFLASLGYAPALHLDVLDKKPTDSGTRRMHLQIGIAGFAFGNVMLLSFPGYLGLPEHDKVLQPLFGWIAAALATPVFLYSARDYWRAGLVCLQRRMLTVDFPILVGLSALYLQSLATALRGGGPAYFDSFTGLVLFLLCSRIFQQKTYDALSFDRDYRSYFPLSVTRHDADGERSVPVTQLRVGDRICVRNQELIPADAKLVQGPACIDYSFVTGESAPQARAVGDRIYAGGRQVGARIELTVEKEASQSHLTSLWNHAAFKKGEPPAFGTITNFAGRYFTYMVLTLAALSGAYWSVAEPARAVRVLAAVLIVACPCALALAAPFTLGAALRVLGRRHIYLKHAGVLETLAKCDAIVFDKTGTLTLPATGAVRFEGPPLSAATMARVRNLCLQSTHAHSQKVARFLEGVASGEATEVGAVADFDEVAGAGICGTVQGVPLRLGSRAWLAARGGAMPPASDNGTEVCLMEGDRELGRFIIGNTYRPGLQELLAELRRRYHLALVSGDNAHARAALAPLFGPQTPLHFQQSPESKLAFIRQLQDAGRRVVMIGDGLNDAGALKQSDVGIALTDDVGAFSPACDAIWSADHFADLPNVLRFSRRVMGVVVFCFLVSFVYNAVGLTLATTGRLSPLASAVLMPASSLTIIGLSLLGTRLAACSAGLRGAQA